MRPHIVFFGEQVPMFDAAVGEMREADVVSIHVDGQEANTDLIGRREFAMMKTGALFLNLSRGFTVDVDALHEALCSGHLAGAALDVFPHEPKKNGDPFTSDLAKGIIHLLTSDAPFGTYNLSGRGPVVSWCDVARRVYELVGHDPAEVTAVTTAEYYADREGIAPRPLSSALDLSKIEAAGFTPGRSLGRRRGLSVGRSLWARSSSGEVPWPVRPRSWLARPGEPA